MSRPPPTRFERSPFGALDEDRLFAAFDENKARSAERMGLVIILAADAPPTLALRDEAEKLGAAVMIVQNRSGPFATPPSLAIARILRGDGFFCSNPAE